MTSRPRAIVLTSLLAWILTPTGATADPPSTLDGLVVRFFHTDDVAERRELSQVIARAADGSVDAVAQAVREVDLWSDIEGHPCFFSFERGDGSDVDVSLRLPDGYDPRKPYPVLICMPDNTINALNALSDATRVLGDAIRGFVLVCPRTPIGGSFHQPLAASSDTGRFMRALRRRIHTDTNRVYLFGAGAGGDRAWLSAIMQADWFAGAVVMASCPPAPYPEQVYPLLLPNLRNVPVLSAWSPPNEELPSDHRFRIAAHNRGIVEFARRARLPITGLELPFTSPFSTTLPLNRVTPILTHCRPPVIRNVAHRFRYPEQGRASWLRMAEPREPIWQADQLAILPAAGTDRDAFIADTVRSRLPFLSGIVDGQTLTIESRGCARIDILLTEGLVDLDQPVTVVCNGRKRHTQPAEPSIKTLLDTAYEDWDVQRLVFAKLSISIRTDPEPDN